ncbi:MAG: hypothetical protein Q7V63_05290 [Gammaproteobacteria bacterium]|nr:hypothetical protein [Gammaproteobacteria bacterium]
MNTKNFIASATVFAAGVTGAICSVRAMDSEHIDPSKPSTSPISAGAGIGFGASACAVFAGIAGMIRAAGSSPGVTIATSGSTAPKVDPDRYAIIPA